MKWRRLAVAATMAAALAAGCDALGGKGKADDEASEPGSKKSGKRGDKKKESESRPAPTGDNSVQPAAVTDPSQQTYPEDGITKISDACDKAFAIVATAPNSVGPDYEWTWTRQAFLANQQFKVVDGAPSASGQVSFELHQASDKFNNSWVLVAKCHDGLTCNKVVAMYKGVVKNAPAQPVCGSLPMDLGPATFKKPVLREAGFSSNTLPDEKDATGLCARLQACTVAMDPPAKARKETIGFDCQKAPSKFNTACAHKYPCAEVMKCLEDG